MKVVCGAEVEDHSAILLADEAVEVDTLTLMIGLRRLGTAANTSHFNFLRGLLSIPRDTVIQWEGKEWRRVDILNAAAAKLIKLNQDDDMCRTNAGADGNIFTALYVEIKTSLANKESVGLIEPLCVQTPKELLERAMETGDMKDAPRLLYELDLPERKATLKTPFMDESVTLSGRELLVEALMHTHTDKDMFLTLARATDPDEKLLFESRVFLSKGQKELRVPGVLRTRADMLWNIVGEHPSPNKRLFFGANAKRYDTDPHVKTRSMALALMVSDLYNLAKKLGVSICNVFLQCSHHILNKATPAEMLEFAIELDPENKSAKGLYSHLLQAEEENDPEGPIAMLLPEDGSLLVVPRKVE